MPLRQLPPLIAAAALCGLSAANADGFDNGLRAHLTGDTQRALEIWEQEAAQGDTSAQFSLGLLYATGDAGTKDLAKASTWWLKAAEAGDVRAQLKLGDFYSKQSHFDFDQAKYWYEAAADNGSSVAYTRLADLIVLTHKDIDNAKQELHFAFTAGGDISSAASMIAAHRLGELSLWGIGADPDLGEAEAWLLISATSGYAPSQYTLGQMHIYGLTRAPDPVEGFNLIEQAAEQGFPPAEYNLGKFYRDGSEEAGVPRDYSTSAWWFERSAEQGYARAQLALARRYFYGEGVDQDHIKAFAWATIAHDNENEEAEHLLDALENILDEAAILRAKIQSEIIREGIAAGYNYSSLAEPLSREVLVDEFFGNELD